MRFADKKEQFIRTIEMVSLTISLGAVFFQIWILITALEAFFRGQYKVLLPSLILSGLAFLACAVGALLTNIPFLKGIYAGRSQNYSEAKRGMK